MGAERPEHDNKTEDRIYKMFQDLQGSSCKIMEKSCKSCLHLTPSLPKLLGTEAPDPIQPKAENQAVLFPQPHVEARKLPRNRTAVPTVSQRHSGADQRAVASSRPLLEVEEERRAAKKSPLTIAEKHRRAPLRATDCSRLEPTGIGKPQVG